MSLYYNFLYMHNLHYFSGREIGDQSLTNHLGDVSDLLRNAAKYLGIT